MFLNANINKLIVHDIDLKRWAMVKQKEVNLENFKASVQWLRKFKKSNRIVSRKITKLITQVSYNNEGIYQDSQLFVKNNKDLFESSKCSHIFNTDQSGFNMEMHSGRTLEIKGTKAIERKVQSISSTTHSYTIQPTIAADGTLLSPLFIVLQESGGVFGPIVKKNLFDARNVYVAPSKSGKLSKELLKEWFNNIYFTNTPDNSILFVDSWTAYNKQDDLLIMKPQHKTIKILQIPPKTTCLIQPLDVYFFRMWKNFVIRFSDRVILDSLNVNLYQRNNIIKLQSLVYFQFSAARFKPFIKYSWYKCGYLTERPEKFQTPVEFCFDSINDTECVCHDCLEGQFILCSWCEKLLCFHHFFEEYHYCN